MKPLVFTFLVLLLGACTESKQQVSKDSDTSALDRVYNNIKEHKKLPEKVLLTYDVEHNFSSKQQKDHFKLTIYGDSIYTGILLLQVISYDKRIIYADTFAARGLMWDLNDSAITVKQREDTIKWRASTYFFDDKFIDSPRIDSSDVEPPVMIEDVREIASDKNAIGFIYAYGYEGVYCIAYSKKKKKAVFYFISD